MGGVDDAKSSISSAKGAVDSQASSLKAKQQQYKMARDKADAAKKFAETKDLAFLEGKSATVDKISAQKRRAGKAKYSVEQRQNEFAKAQQLVKSLVDKIEKGAGGGK
jgi:outer membrane protein TolC